MIQQIDLVVFDLDGTLADSLPDIATAANHACRSLGLPEHSAEAIKGMIGGGERQLVKRFLGPGRENLLEEAFKLYFDYYSRHCGDLTRLYPGVKETLPLLQGKKMAVLSNKRQSLTEAVLRVTGIFPFFTAIRGGSEEMPLKPSSEPLLALIKEVQGDPPRTIMVGDKPGDVLAGKGAGTLTLGVTYGYGEPAAVVAAGPDFLVDRFADIEEIVLEKIHHKDTETQRNTEK
ncbi:MAG: HAD family hydrolase [Deltaproteobacteria bacterium]|nr:MAG: HAD family hydrolase [Deltaproteobacteria bacterium]